MKSTTNERLKDLIGNGKVEDVKKFLEENPTFNVNEDLALHVACHYGHHEIVSVLGAYLQMNVNQKDIIGYTPFLLGCYWGKVEVVKVLLKDSRVDINMTDDDERTPLWCASYWGYVEVIEWVIALRGDELDLDKKGKYYLDEIEYTTIEIARKENKTEVVSLLERFMANPTQTRHELRVELGLVDEDAAELFAMTVFLCDDFLRLKEANSPAAPLRFFNVASQLPMELQMVLCYRVFGSSKENIKSKDSEPAFKSVARGFLAASR
jgi:hypothetical protein